MNQPQTESAQVPSTSPTHDGIPGVARVEPIAIPPSGGLGERKSLDTVLGDFVSNLLKIISRTLSPELIETILEFSKKFGHSAVLGGAGLTFVYAIYGGIKYNSFATFAVGLGFVAAMAVAQYAAIRLLGAAHSVISGTPSRVSSTAFLDCIGLLALLFAVTTLLGGIAGSIAGRSLAPLIPAMIMSLASSLFGAVALNPRVVNVNVGEGTAGDEAIGLLSFLFKAGLKMVPLFFLLIAAAGTLAIAMSFFSENGSFASMAQSLVNMLPVPAQIPYGLTGSAVVLMACFIPIFSYFVFLLQHLVVDVLRAILAVPAKLDVLRRQP
jgi:hypothetical protein